MQEPWWVFFSAGSILSDLDHGTCVHGQIIKNGCEDDVAVKNALGMYCKCGNISSADILFSRTEFMKDVVSWNEIISGYMQGGYAKETISSFHQMNLENFHPDLVTFVSILPAVAYLAALKRGHGFSSAVYKREKWFDEMEHKDKVSWNAVHGQGVDAVALFSLMQKNPVQVDSVSFIGVPSACRHTGLVKEGKNIFQAMHEKHNVEPELEHYACLVYLLGLAGLFDEALNLINTMPMEPDAGVWGALLGACRVHSNAELGEIALSHLVKLEPRNAANFIVI
ncbi:pentatricopeptide repeat-containing protein At2g39620-like [Pyrus communis]|uniref:pentatricopeptide repeat-containing protein At2g39620-like n=1 Tax=Pyrus communis TaxID=23211 RepID=UPI0035C1272D